MTKDEKAKSTAKVLRQSKRSKVHNQNIIIKAFLQCSADKSPTHLHLLSETIKLGLLDKDFKIWKSKFQKSCSHKLQEWVRENLRNHPKIGIRDKVIVYWREDE